jgi:hypothetical protein
MSPLSAVHRLPSSQRVPSASVCPRHVPAWQRSPAVHSLPSAQTMFSLPAVPTHRRLPLTIAHWSVTVQMLPSSQVVPTGAAVVPGVQIPLLLQLSPRLQGLPSHSRIPADGVALPHLVTAAPEESVPSATHFSFTVHAL